MNFKKKINNVIDCGGKGYLHLWLECKEIIFAIIETEDGALREIPARNIQFVENYSESKSSVSI
jgi:hypothetical protein